MTGKWRIIEIPALIVTAIFMAAVSCSQIEDYNALTLHISCGDCHVKSMADPDENRLSDANIYVYDAAGLLQEHLWVNLYGSENDNNVTVDAISRERYSIYVFCNAGFRMNDMSEAQLMDFKYYLSSPDAYSKGIPMAGAAKGVTAGKAKPVIVEVERLMSKISLRIDRSKLNNDVDFYVHTVKIGNCPRCVHPFAPVPLTERNETFALGFNKFGDGCFDLNSYGAGGLSDEVSLFVLENPASSLDGNLCPYVELQMDYLSDRWYTDGGEGLVYRFFIRENDSYTLERNCHYRITVTPHENGLLCEDSWRVDKSGLYAMNEEYEMTITPEGSWADGTFYPYYYQMGFNSSMHFGIRTVPEDIPVRLREDLVEDELEQGRAEYVMDSNGKGFTVNSLNNNCMSIMEIIPSEPMGENFAQTIVIEISG